MNQVQKTYSLFEKVDEINSLLLRVKEDASEYSNTFCNRFDNEMDIENNHKIEILIETISKASNLLMSLNVFL